MSANELEAVIVDIAAAHRAHIRADARLYMEVDIGRTARRLGYDALGGRYGGVHALIPLKRPQAGMKVRVDGRSFVNYAQFASGVVVPLWVAQAAGIAFRPYLAGDSMVLNFN